MNELSVIFVIGLFSGSVLGLIFFGGLWFSVRRFLTHNHAALWMAISLILRSLVVTLGFYWLMNFDRMALIPSLLGFLLARKALVSRSRRHLKRSNAMSDGR